MRNFLYPQTGVWGVMGSLTVDFTSPLRQLLSETKAQSRGQLQNKREEHRTARDGSSAAQTEPAVTVEVGHGERLPEPSLQEEINVRIELFMIS